MARDNTSGLVVGLRRWAFPGLCFIAAVGFVGLRMRAGDSLSKYSLSKVPSLLYTPRSAEEMVAVHAPVAVAPPPPAEPASPTEQTPQSLRTVRVGCREYPKGAQSCVFKGVSCVETNADKAQGVVRPLVYMVDDERPDRQTVSSDLWCQLRHKSADPRYFGPRNWPLRTDLFAPMWSCLNAKWRTAKSLFPRGMNDAKIRWLDDFSLVDLDYVSNDHNNHYIKDLVWLLDVSLWQQMLSRSSTASSNSSALPVLFPPPKHIFLPQSSADFAKQTGRDVNRLNLAIMLRLDAAKLYENVALEPGAQSRKTRRMLATYPSLSKQLVFYGDEREKPNVDLVCTRRLTVGAKLGNFGDERVCQHMRKRAWDVFGIKEPPHGTSGFLHFPQPPKRVVLLHRHRTRKFTNLDEIGSALREDGARYGYEVEIHPTSVLKTAEDHVKFFSRVGVLLTPHGSQSMGGIYMPRHAALIEVFPPGYTDFAFNLLSQSCNLWYYELQGVIPKHLEELYKKRCGNKLKSIFDQCVQMKNMDVTADVPEVLRTVHIALRKLGHDMTRIK